MLVAADRAARRRAVSKLKPASAGARCLSRDRRPQAVRPFRQGVPASARVEARPGLMQRVGQRYGPIDFSDPNMHFPMDWRHPDSHAIYWAVKGLDIAKQDKDREIDDEEVNTDRMVLHSLQNLFRYGKIMILQGWEDRGSRSERRGPARRARTSFSARILRIFDSYEKALGRSMRNTGRTAAATSRSRTAIATCSRTPCWSSTRRV